MNPQNDERTDQPPSFAIIRGVCRLFGLLLLALGTLKLLDLMFPSPKLLEYLSLANPILSLFSNRSVLFAASFVEICVGCYLLTSRQHVAIHSGLLLWLVVVALCYRIGLAAVHYKGPCGCLLGINRFMPLSTATQTVLAEVILLL